MTVRLGDIKIGFFFAFKSRLSPLAPGPDKIMNEIQIEGFDELAHGLLHTFNQCLVEGVFPKLTKKATKIHIPKESRN